MLVGAGLLWLIALVMFGGIREQPGATSGGGNALEVVLLQTTEPGEEQEAEQDDGQ